MFIIQKMGKEDTDTVEKINSEITSFVEDTTPDSFYIKSLHLASNFFPKSSTFEGNTYSIATKYPLSYITESLRSFPFLFYTSLFSFILIKAPVSFFTEDNFLFFMQKGDFSPSIQSIQDGPKVILVNEYPYAFLIPVAGDFQKYILLYPELWRNLAIGIYPSDLRLKLSLFSDYLEDEFPSRVAEYLEITGEEVNYV